MQDYEGLIDRLILEKVNQDTLKRIISAIVERAESGDLKAAQWLLVRFDEAARHEQWRERMAFLNRVRRA